MKKDKQQILSEVNELASRCGSIADAILVTCEKYSIEIDTIAHYIRYSKDMKEALREEYTTLNLLK